MSLGAMDWVYKHSPYRGAKFAIHLAIADSANEEHGSEFWMTLAKLATKVRQARPTVSEAVAEIVRDGLLEMVAPPSTSKSAGRYRFLMPELPVVYDPSAPGGLAQGSSPETTTSALFVTPDDEGSSPETTKFVTWGDTEPKRTQEGTQEHTVRTVFDAWRDATGHHRAKLDRKRTSLIRDRLKEGFTEDELIDAVRGWRHGPWYRGENPTNTVYNDLHLLLRDAKNVEKFRDMERTEEPIRDDNITYGAQERWG